ncbi:protein-L-isoaspartate(D-aspartate) O-methyltransferase [bacterium]|nr:protein-L-isoaspartate(D-aspartate) O-methyltransferase [bacterium]
MKMRRKWMVTGIFFLSLSFFLFPSSSQKKDSYTQMRKNMVQSQLKARDITDERVLEVMKKVPRHLFVSPRYKNQAYEDHPLPIGEGQTISQPYIVALMTQYLDVNNDEKVLEIGTGSGYQAAVLSHLAAQVYSIEIREKLAQKAAQRLNRLHYDNVMVKCGDGYFGWEKHAPFDAIIVTCAANHVPPSLMKQLKEGGKLIIPLGSVRYFQTLTLITKVDGEPKVKHISGVRFVPMIGEAQKRDRQ